MALLVSKETAVRLRKLLLDNEHRIDPTNNRSLAPSASAAEPDADYDAPFAMRWSEINGSWIIHLPPRCATFSGDSGDMATDLSQAVDLDGETKLVDWYKVSATSGVCFVWVESSGASDDWWGSWETAVLSAGDSLPDGVAAAGAFAPVAYLYSDDSGKRVQQYLSSVLRLAVASCDGVSIEVQTDSNGYPLFQLFDFDDSSEVTALGLSECIKADPDTGEISVIAGVDQYQLVVRVLTGDGSVIGYMPLNVGDDDDPTAGDSKECGVGDYDGEMGNEDDDSYPGDGGDSSGVDSGDSSDEYPGKGADCW